MHLEGGKEDGHSGASVDEGSSGLMRFVPEPWS